MGDEPEHSGGGVTPEGGSRPGTKHSAVPPEASRGGHTGTR